MNQIDKGTIVRTVVLFYALINQGLVMAGWSALPFTEGDVEMVVSGILTFVAAIVAWWKDNPVTKKARNREQILKERGLK